MKIVKAAIEDDLILTAITKKSKAHWGYSEEQLEKWSETLTLTKEYIHANEVYKIVIDHLIVGYYSYFLVDTTTIKLDSLFVLPKYIGHGLGKKLMNDFLERVRSSGIQKITVDSDPNAALFYSKYGFVKIGLLETSIKDRFLPIMELKM